MKNPRRVVSFLLGASRALSPIVEQTDILGRGVFANDHFAFRSAPLRMDREQDTIALDVDP